MIGREKRVLLRHYLEQGMNKAVIARDLGVSHRTVYHWIETGQLDRELDEERVGYGPRCLMPSKLDPYKPLIDTRLKEYPKLTAVRLFKEVRAAGYPGSYNQVKRYVRKVRPRPPEEPVVRFETAPGRQGQVDFAHFRLPWGKRYALIVVLGYSRLLWVQFYTRQTMKALMHGLESSFSYFGGVPRELLFDQMKAIVIEDGGQVEALADAENRRAQPGDAVVAVTVRGPASIRIVHFGLHSPPKGEASRPGSTGPPGKWKDSAVRTACHAYDM